MTLNPTDRARIVQLHDIVMTALACGKTTGEHGGPGIAAWLAAARIDTAALGPHATGFLDIWAESWPLPDGKPTAPAELEPGHVIILNRSRGPAPAGHVHTIVDITDKPDGWRHLHFSGPYPAAEPLLPSLYVAPTTPIDLLW
ncbi:hypothetical protein [Actinoplanes sp. NPDC051851]|uniref:hypothetical protein n=1 Tax=Actinoplanes sp. NPDC051851 TaxID=3154753 RepID=UPI00343473DD